MATFWRIELLGGLRAHRHDDDDGGDCGEPTIITNFETRKAASLLACLALHAPRARARDALAEQLWPDEDAEAVRDWFRHALAALRRVLEPPGTPPGRVLIADRAEVSLSGPHVATDVAQFESALRRLPAPGAAPPPPQHVCALRAVLALYGGELLPGFHESWVVGERARLAHAHRDALLRLAEALAEAGDLSGAIEHARRAAQADPWREDAHAALMGYFARAGRFSEALRQYGELERVLQTELGIAPSPATQALLARLRAEAARAPVVAAAVAVVASKVAPVSAAVLEPEGGAVPLDSPFYIVREADRELASALARQDSIVLVKGARQMGKTSLLARGMQQARAAGARVALTDLQKLTSGQMASADTLFRTLVEMMIEQMELDLSIETVWNERRGWNVNFERFLRREVLGKEGGPVVWGLDEADRLFGHPFGNEVFGLFRSWHNERSLDPAGPWSRLTLAIAYATEAHLFITDLNQSPFNVGTRLALRDFSPAEVAELNRRYGEPLQSETEVARFFGLVGGQPYLVRRGLHALADAGPERSLAAFAAEADHGDGMFGDHLRRLTLALRQDCGLCEAMRALLRGDGLPSDEDFFRLRSAGVVTGTDRQNAQPRCRLYQTYLEQHL